MRSIVVNILFFVLGICLMVGVMVFFGFDKVVSQMSSANINIFLLAVVVEAVTMLLAAFRLKIIAGIHPPLGFLKALKASVVGEVVDMLTPIAKIGGQPAKISILKPVYGFSKSVAVVTIDTFSDLISFYIVIVLAMIMILFSGLLPFSTLFPFLMLFAISILVLTAFLYLLMNEELLRRVIIFVKKLISRYRKVSDLDYAARFKKYTGLLTRNRKRLYTVIIITAILRVLEVTRLWIIFHALGLNVSTILIVFAWSFILLLNIVPWLPGGLGLVEAGGAYVFILFGIRETAAVGAIMLDRLVSYWFVLIPGIFYMMLIAKMKIMDIGEERAKKSEKLFKKPAIKKPVIIER
ncbi:MAG: flippase-like domain-containing protein [Candidatus Aenigmarchaeota archaeon]|nr:flippase-like domain-containing protein [Candidatus Aenigmarchaeota archaeon]